MMLQAARALMTRDLYLLWARRGDALQPALFALLTVVLFALGLGGDAKSLAPVASAVLWLAVLLAGLLALDNLFRSDAEDGSLEQWMLAPVPLWWLVLVRTVMHWLTTALPVIVAVPLLGELLHLPHAQLPVLLASLLLGTPILSLLGAVVAALTVGMRRAAGTATVRSGPGIRCRRGGRACARHGCQWRAAIAGCRTGAVAGVGPRHRRSGAADCASIARRHQKLLGGEAAQAAPFTLETSQGQLHIRRRTIRPLAARPVPPTMEFYP